MVRRLADQAKHSLAILSNRIARASHVHILATGCIELGMIGRPGSWTLVLEAVLALALALSTALVAEGSLALVEVLPVPPLVEATHHVDVVCVCADICILRKV
jgi:hypothetical protein